MPGEKYEFPWIYNNNDKRKFQRIWLEKFKFLSYSAVPGKEGAFCRYCVLMGKLSGGRGDKLFCKNIYLFAKTTNQVQRVV